MIKQFILSLTTSVTMTFAGIFCSGVSADNAKYSTKQNINQIADITLSSNLAVYGNYSTIPKVVICNTKSPKETFQYGRDYITEEIRSKDKFPEIGEHKIKIKGMGTYYGEKTLSYKVLPEKPKIASVSFDTETSVNVEIDNRHNGKVELSVADNPQMNNADKYYFHKNR